MADEPSPWPAVFAIFERFEDGLALKQVTVG